MGGSSGGTTTTTQKLSPEQSQLINQAMPTWDRYLQNTPQVSAQPVAGFDPLQQQAQQSALGAIKPIQQVYGQALGGLGRTQNFGQQLYQRALNPGMDNAVSQLPSFRDASSPYIQGAQEATLAPITEALRTQVLPGIRAGAITSGQLGGTRQALGTDSALTNYSRTAANALAPLSEQLYGRAMQGDITGALQTQQLGVNRANALLGAGTQFAGLAPQLAQTGAQLGGQMFMLPARIQDAIGSQRRALGQAQQTAQHQADMQNMFLPLMIAQQATQAASGIPGGTVTSNQHVPGPSPLQTLLGVGSMFAGLPFF